MNQPTLLSAIARWIVSADFPDLPDGEIAAARAALTDFVAVAAAGSGTSVVRNAAAYAVQNERTGACVQQLGRSVRFSPRTAAFLNGTAAHALDFDDVSWTTIGHPTVGIAPTALSLAVAQGLSGREFLTAYVVGAECAHQIARWTMPQLSEHGWHTTLANGVFGAAAAAAWQLKTDASTTTNALAIAASLASGIRANFGSQTKAIHAGLSNLHGMMAVELAAAGITGKDDALEASDGYAACFAARLPREKCTVDLGSRWDLMENGLVFKQYPCCSGTHPALDVWGEWVDKVHPKLDDIEAVHLGVSLLGPRELISHCPRNAVEAKFSMEFALASRLVYQRAGIEEFTDDKVLDVRIQALMKKMTMEIDPDLAKLGFIGTAPVRIRIKTKSGVVCLANDLAKGNPEKPLSESDRKAKFSSCVSPIAGSETAARWWNELSTLELLSPNQLSLLGAL